MKTIMSICITLFALLSLVGCGHQVQVPPAHVGKVMGRNGYREGTIATSKFRLDTCFAYCDKLVILDVSDIPIKERMELFMPKDKLNMTFDIRLTIAVSPQQYDQLFNKIPPKQMDDSEMMSISIQTAYATYAGQIIRSEAREYLSQFTIVEIASNRQVINAELAQRLSTIVEQKTPFVVKYAGLADVQYPEVITLAQVEAAKRREQIEQEEAQLEISKITLKRQLQEQQMQRAIDVEKAEAEAEVNRILSKAVTPAYIKYRELEVLDKLTSSPNKTFIPSSMLDSFAGQVMLGNAASTN